MLHKRSALIKAHKYNVTHARDKRVCQFCDISQVKEVIYESDHMRVIRNHVSYDQFEGAAVQDHLMVIPKKHHRTLATFSDEEKADYVSMLARYEDGEYSVYSRGRLNKMRSVEHLHTHLLQLPGERVAALFYIRKPYIMLRTRR